MEDEKDAFYVVRKGDVVGIYKSFTDIPVSDGSLRIYKGYHLSKTAEEYLVSHGLKEATYSLVSHGLKEATYSLSATDVYEGLFGRIVACPYRHPYSSGEKTNDLNSLPKRLDFQGTVQYDIRNYSSGGKKSEVYPPMRSHGAVQSDRSMIGSSSTNSQRHHVLAGTQSDLSTCLSCTLVFDGAAKGNPGPAGAGAVLRAEDGSKVCQMREGVGFDTINVAEYRALILGLKHAVKEGYKHVRVQGDSQLVCKQVQGLWKTKNQNMAYLCNEVKVLKDKFLSFQITHFLREYNSEADAQANLAINLRAGQVEEDCKSTGSTPLIL